MKKLAVQKTKCSGTLVKPGGPSVVPKKLAVTKVPGFTFPPKRGGKKK